MMDWISNNTSTVVIVVVAVVFMISFYGLRNYTQNKIVRAFQAQDFVTYAKTVNSFLGRYFFRQDQREYFMMNAYLVQQDTKSAIASAKFFTGRKMNPKFKTEVAFRLFNYFIGIRNKEGAKLSLDMLVEVLGEKEAIRSIQTYDIYIEKKSNHIQALEADLEKLRKTDEDEVDHMEYCQIGTMLGYQYAYEKNNAKAKEMFELAKQYAPTDLIKDVLSQAMKDLKVK